MPNWQGSTRRQRLPANWGALREKVLKRDKRKCRHLNSDGTRCAAPANQVDHIVANDDDSPENLRALCEFHHQRKSSAEGGQARAARRRQVSQSFRRTERHPGQL